MQARGSHLDRFRHEALFYAGPDGFLDGVLPFLREGLDGAEPMLVAVDAGKVARIRDALGGQARAIQFVEMAGLGHNPARIIPAWREFVARGVASGRPFRGIGEPIWPGRTPTELAECHLHESLLNNAFEDGPPWWLLCPYDTRALAPEVVDEAHRTHPFVSREGVAGDSGTYPGTGVPDRWREPLEDPASVGVVLPFDISLLREVRRAVAEQAWTAGLHAERVDEVVLAVNEVATNSLRYGGGEGTLRAWSEPGAVIFEVRDTGSIDDPLVGREWPPADRVGGRGLWLANQVCDLVQVRSVPEGTIVRIRVAVPA